MKRITVKIIVSVCCLLVAGIMSVREVSAEMVTGCHCFKNRSFDPEHAFLADDYILATTFNSLMARSFAVSKKQIVMLKMRGGAGQDDLLLALRTASVTGRDYGELLDKRKNGLSWQAILAGLKDRQKVADDRLLKGLLSGKVAGEASRRVADDMLAGFFQVPLQEIDSLRKKGLGDKELALLFLLARETGKKAAELAGEYQQGGKSFSEIAFGFGIEPAEAGKLILNTP